MASHGHFPRGVGNVVQVTFGITGILQVDGRRHEVVLEGQRARRSFPPRQQRRACGRSRLWWS